VGGDTTKLLYSTEETLDEVATLVEVLVEFTLNATVAARWDNASRYTQRQTHNPAVQHWKYSLTFKNFRQVLVNFME
jgi:hypothetical protein